MGDLRDQLKKAKLLSKKDAKRIAHEERLRRAELGGAKAVEAADAAHRAELAAKKEANRAADRAKQATLQEQRDAASERAACIELLQREARKPGRGGGGRWYFRAADGALPSLELPASERVQMQEGALSVVRLGPAGSHDYGILAVAHARRLARVMPERVVWSAVPPSGGVPGGAPTDPAEPAENDPP